MATNNSITPGINPRDWFFDAFYLDEFAPKEKNPLTQCRLNRFSRPGTAGATPRFGLDTVRIDEKNPLEDSSLVSTVEKTTGNPEAGKSQTYLAFASAKLRGSRPAKPKLCLFFGPPGPVMNRQGMRAFFENSDVVLITLPGIEDSPKFGIGISPAQIDRLLIKVFSSSAPAAGSWTIHTLAAYSTGFRGMNRSINNLYSATQVSSVKKLIYFDCLYRHDSPAPPGVGTGEHTFHALDKVLTNSPSVKFIIYELTGNVTDNVNAIVGGTPRRTNNSFWNRWPTKADPLQPATNTVTEVINFKTGLLSALQALACARLVDAGLEDGYFDRPFIAARFPVNGKLLLDVIDKQLKPRGSYASKAVFATATGKTFVGNWLAPASDIPKLAALLESMRIPVIDKFRLLGWSPTGSTGDIAHDSHVPEFGWEHLLG